MGCAMPRSIDRGGGSPPASEGSLAEGVHRVNGTNEENARRTIERVARESYGRLVAYLSVHTHDLASAEDALSNALVSALNHWPREGVPKNPEAWLMTAARRSLIDVIRHQKVVLESEPTLKLLTDNSTEMVCASTPQ